MKNLKKVICILLCSLMAVSMCGCSLLKLNEEKDLQSTVAKINGKNYTKGEFLDYYKVSLVMYALNGYAVPSTDEDVQIYKEYFLEEFVRSRAIAEYCAEKGLASDKVLADEKAALLENIKASYPDAAYDEFLKGFGLDAETFENSLDSYMELSLATDAFYQEGVDHSDVIGDVKAFTVGDTVVSQKTFYYYAINMMFYSYVQNQTFPQSSEDFVTFFGSVKDSYLEYYCALYNYGVKQGLELTDEEIEEGASTFDMLGTYFGEEIINSYYDEFFLSDEDVAAARLETGKFMAMTDKVNDLLAADYDPSEEDITAYYEQNQATVFAEKVSAYHILTEDAARAKELADEAVDAGTFMALYDRIKADSTDETIREAADLGSFYYTQMVPEFSAPVYEMAVGEVKGMILSQFGYHLVYVYDRTPAKTLENDFDEIRQAYIDANKSTYTFQKLNEIADAEKVEDGKFNVLPGDLLSEMLNEKYGIKTDSEVALR